MIGKTLGHYRIVEKLGAGGMGEVYKAQDLHLDRFVALKVLPAEKIADDERKRRFIQEAKAVSALSHPNVCVIHEVSETEDGLLFLAMEHIAGETLGSLSAACALTTAEILDIALQVADALDEAHDKGIIHRDIKPSNIMITPKGQAKVLDFGLAKRQLSEQQPEAVSEKLTQMQTEAGVILGTVQYMSPEQALGKKLDQRTDIFSLGAVLYEMAAHRRPFLGDNSIETLGRIIHTEPEEITQYNSEIPPELARIIKKCLEKPLDQRYASAAELLSDLKRLKRSFESQQIRLESVIPVPRPSSISRRRGWLMAIVAALAGCVALYFFLVRGSKIESDAEPSASEQRPVLRKSSMASAIPEANEYFDKAMLFLRTQHRVPRAQEMLEKALQLDPKFAEARGYHGFCYFLMIDGGLSNDPGLLYKAEEEIRQALQGNPNSPISRSTRVAILLFQGRKELVPAESRLALEANPGDPDVGIWLVNYYQLNGDYGAAEKLAREIIQRDPLFFPARVNLGEILRQQGDFAGAIRQLEKILEQDPQNIYAIVKMAHTWGEQGELRLARQILDRARPEDRKIYQYRFALALQLALEGEHAAALKEMDAEVLKFAGIIPYLPSMAAQFYAVLGDTDKALEWLDKALRIGDERSAWFSRDPLLNSIRSDPRFKQILDAIALRRQVRVQSPDKR